MGTGRKTEVATAAEFAYYGYDKLAACRELVEDCLGGQWQIKEKTKKYLPADKWQQHHNDDYNAYLFRALFFDYTRKALNRYVGMLNMGEPDISLPENGKLDFLKDRATQYGDGLKSLQRRLNEAQLSQGLICCLLESTGKDDTPFVIQTYRARDFLRTKFDTEDGRSFARFVLLDESGYEYDTATKQDVEKRQLRVLGLDRNNEYYQAGIEFGAWPDFDLLEPNSGNIVYPDYHGKRMNRIPFTWCGASSLSGTSFDDPPILNVANAEISLYQLYADYRQVLYMTGQSPLFITGLKGDENKITSLLKAMYVNSGAINALPEGAQAQYLEVPAQSLSILSQEVEKLKELCSHDALSLSDNKSNQSGVAIQLIQDSNTSPLQIINSVAGDAITEQLRYAAMWIGVDEEEILGTRYTPSKDFAEANLTVQELISVDGTDSLTTEEKRNIWLENGYGDPKKTIEEFLEEKEKAREESMQNSPVIQGNGNPFAKKEQNNDSEEE